jgi:RNA polymerase sigma-70 factor (ECF subfamily)
MRISEFNESEIGTPNSEIHYLKFAVINDEQILTLLARTATYEKGFRFLMQQYQVPLYAHIRRLVLFHDDANDVLQNTFVKVFRNIDRFEGKSKLYTWLYRIATNEAISFLQQRCRKETDNIQDAQGYLANQLKADVWFDGDEIQLKLQQALLQLPEKQRVVFNLRYYDEMPYEEMSQVLDTSVGALKASYHHAVRKVEAFLKSVAA